MTEDRSKQSPPFPVEHDAAIGRVARAWGHLEHLVDMALWDLADVEQQFGACITSQMVSVYPKLKAMGALVKLRGGSQKLIKRIEEFQSRLYEVAEQRARTVHDARLSDENSEIYRWQTTSSSKSVIFGPQKEPISDLVSLRSRIQRRIRTFEDIWREIHAELLTSGKRPLVQLVRIDPHPLSQGHKPNIESPDPPPRPSRV